VSSEQAQRLWTAFRNAPHKQIDMKLPQRREAGEHAEDPTAEPAGITFTDAPEVAGIWAKPPDVRAGVAILYLFGGGYVLGSPASRRKTAGHLARAARARILVPSYRLAPEHKFPAAVDDARRAYQWLIGEGVEPARVVIAGDSAGGGLAVAPDAVTPRASPPDAGGLRCPLTLGRPRLHGREHDHPRGRGLHGHA